MGIPQWKRTLYIIWSTQFIALAGVQLVFPFLPLYLEDLGVHNKAQQAFYSGVTGTALGLAMFITSPIWGALADRFGRKPLLLRAYIGAMVATFLQSINHDLRLFFVILAIQGGFSGTPSAAAALLASTTPRDKVPYALGLLQVSFFVAGVAGPLIGGVLSEAIGMRETFLVASFGFGLAFLLVLFTVKEDFTPPAVKKGPMEAFMGNVRDAAASAAIMKMIAIIFMINISISFGRPSVALFVKALDPGGPNKSEASYVFAALAFTSAIAALAVGNFAGKIGHRKVLIALLFGAGLAYLPVSLSVSVLMLIICMGGVGLFSGGCLPSASALLSMNAPAERQGAAFGFAGSAQALANAMGPLLGGTVAAAFGLRTVYVVVAAAMITTSLIATFILPHPPATPPLVDTEQVAEEETELVEASET